MTEINNEQIIAMSVAAIAEEQQEDISHIRVISFREIHRSSLEQYIADRHILYKKYILKDE